MHSKLAPEYKLIRRNIKTTRPWDKLDYRRLGPFSIQQQVNPVAYRLRLPAAYEGTSNFQMCHFWNHTRSQLYQEEHNRHRRALKLIIIKNMK